MNSQLSIFHSSSLMPDLNASHAADCFVLLDDNRASDAQPRSRLYTGFAGEISCSNQAELAEVLEALQQALRQGLNAVGLFSYDLGEQLHGLPLRAAGMAPSRILLFAQCERLTADQVEKWLATQAGHDPAGVLQVQPNIGAKEFAAAIDRIRAYIEAGDTYQVNYTYRLHFRTYGNLAGLYLELRTRQPVPYGALLALPDGSAVLSLSPELFVRNDGGLLTARPMKGTARASGDARLDAARAAALAADSKNRAENLMIVDLLRNDLGRIAEPGSVRAPKLFEVQGYSSVLQMTSTVQAKLREGATLTDLFTAIYPCGSITGAPKRRTMQIIRELENEPRGYYTGAIGWFEQPDTNRAIGDFCLSVPIRTLELEAPDRHGLRAGIMGVGAGIVYDSNAEDEYAECQLKAQFLTGMQHDFELFETMHATKGSGCRHLELHLRRMRASAAFFGFAWDEGKVRDALVQACAILAPGVEYRMRLSLAQEGTCTVQSAPLPPLALPVRLLLASEKTNADHLFLRHKTSVRKQYDAAWRAAEAHGAFDALFCNTRGELTEGGRSNVFVRIGGRWYTPPFSAGILPGVMRSVLLTDPAWNAQERTLTLQDLQQAEQIVACNALRGALPAIVDWSTPI